MDPVFSRHLRFVRRREGANRFLAQCAQTLLVLALPCCIAVLLERLLSITVLTRPVVLAGLGLAALAVGVRFFLTGRRDMQLALLIDERLAFRERFSTALAFAASADPFAHAARAEAASAASHLQLRRRFPIRFTPAWLHAGSAWTLTLLVFAFLPPFDLLGRREEHRKIEAEQQALVETKTQVGAITAAVQKMLGDLDAPALAKDLAELDAAKAPATPEELRREAIRKLGDIAEKLADMEMTEDAETAKELRALMKRLKVPREGAGRDLARALAKGKFDDAQDALKRLKRMLQEQQLSDEGKKTLQKSIEDLAAQLDKLSEEAKKDLEDALKNAGLDPDLARLDAQALKEALEKAGLSKEEAEKLARRARSLRNAAARAHSLAQGCKGCAGGAGSGDGEQGGGTPDPDALMSANATESLADQLAQQQELMDELARLEHAQGALAGMCAGLGESSCDGKGPWMAGKSDALSKGSGGPGRGGGGVDIDRSGPTTAKSSRVPNKESKGPTISTWLSKEEQLPGESRRTLQAAVQAAKDIAAEAIRDNRIPAKYRGAVKQYFGELPEPDAPPEGATSPGSTLPPAPAPQPTEE